MTSPFEVQRPPLGASSELPEQERIDEERRILSDSSRKAGEHSYKKLTATHGPDREWPIQYSRSCWIGTAERAETPLDYVENLLRIARRLKDEYDKAEPRRADITNFSYVSPLDRKSYPINASSLDVYDRTIHDFSKENFRAWIQEMGNTLYAFGDAAMQAKDTETYKAVLEAQLEIQHMFE